LRVVLFEGSGGVGRTTAAAATAVLAARSAKVLLVSSGALGVPPGAEPVAAGELFVLHVDVREAFARRWAADLALPPGAAELVTLLEAREQALGGNWDALLLDGPPLPSLLPLGSLPGTVERLWPEHTRIVHRSSFTDVVGSVQSALASVTELLARASVRLVVEPSAGGVASFRRAMTALSLHGYAVDSVVANRLLPDSAGDSAWARSVRAAQDAALASLEAGVPVRRAPWLADEPTGEEELLGLGSAIYGADDPLAPGPAAPVPAVSRSGPDYELSLPMPYVRRSDVRLARSGDELLLTVGDQLRRLALPAVLRRCVAVGASAGDGAIRVRFRPDPALWPREMAR
jgi:arsenite/tail-anchored protein-transporting ATPase